MIKKKKLSDVYMREVTKKSIKVIKNEELNAYITYKHIIETSQACTIYINGRNMPLVDNGYTILEYSPIEELYNVRLFIDDKGNIIQYYFDIILSSEFIDGEVYYEDLYLDILYDTPYSSQKTDYISLIDQNELLEALNNGDINKKEFDLAYNVANKIMNELLNNSNKFVNRNIKDYFYLKNNEQ